MTLIMVLKKFFFLFFLILLTIPSLILGNYLQYCGAYVYWVFPYIQEGVTTGYVPVESIASPGYTIFIVYISELLAIPPDQVVLLPIGAILYAVSFYLLAKNFFLKDFFIFFLIFYAIWDSTLITNYNVTFYSITHPLFIIFFIMSLKISEFQKIRFNYMCCLFLLYLGVFYVHPEAVLWMIVTLIGVYGYYTSKWLLNIDNNILNAINMNKYLYLIVSFIIIYITWNKLFFSDWLPRLDNFDFSNTLQIFLTSKLGHTTKIEYSGQLFGDFFNYLRLMEYFIIFILIIVGVIYIIKSVKERDFFYNSKYKMVWLILFFITLIDITVYSIEGWISTKFINLFFPVLALLSLSKINININYKKIILVILAIIILLSGLFMIKEFEHNWSTTNTNIEPGTSWCFKHSNHDSRILTDVSTYTKNLIISAKKKIGFIPVFYSLEDYKYLIEHQVAKNFSTPVSFDYALIDQHNIDRVIGTLGNRYFEPLSLHLSYLNVNPRLNIIFIDNYIVTIKPIHF